MSKPEEMRLKPLPGWDEVDEIRFFGGRRSGTRWDGAMPPTRWKA